MCVCVQVKHLELRPASSTSHQRKSADEAACTDMITIVVLPSMHVCLPCMYNVCIYYNYYSYIG